MSSIGIIALSPCSSLSGVGHPSIAIATARAGGIGILDAECAFDAENLIEQATLLQASAGASKIGIRYRCGNLVGVQSALSAISPGAIVSGPSAASLAATSGTAHHSSPAPAGSPDPADRFVIITAGIKQFDKTALKNDIVLAHRGGFSAIVEVVSLQEAELAESCGADAIIAKGNEAGGRVGDTTTFVLIQQCVRNLKVPTWAQGGIGIHTVAAVAAAGAAGVVLDAQLYLCKDAQMPASVQMRLARFDGSETVLVSPSEGVRFRVYQRNPGEHSSLDASGALAISVAAAFEAPSAANAVGSDVWLVGQDAAFARSLNARGGTIAGVMDVLRDAAKENLKIAAAHSSIAPGSPLAKSHGTKYPIVQGAMTRVSDTAEFAMQVAEGGALPFLALSLMRAPEIEKLLAETSAKMNGLPWGVGLLGFVPQNLRKEQLEVVNRHRPPFALIAGGRPDQAKAMEDAGTQCYLHVPSAMLLKSFMEMGSRRFIFEGKECGGHVGPRSSFVLWESMVDTILESIGPRVEASAYHVLFAGGIHDDLSAAMVAALSAPLSARGINVGLLVGTAYLFTEEAVSSGAIVRKFQEAAIECRETVLLETGPGHSIRCIESPYKQTFDERRNELVKEGRSSDEIREELELMNLGRLRVASKGLSRGSSPELSSVSDDDQWRDGMYMIGQVAAMHDRVTTIDKLHATICSGGHHLLEACNQERRVDQYSNAEGHEPIAVIGMSCMFPQANDLEQFWQNIINKVDSITEVPATHFDWRKYYDADPQAPDKVISKWGGFLADIIFDPARYGIPPSSLSAIDPMQVLVLESAREALLDAGYSQRKFPKKRTSVVVANAGHGPITALYSLRSMLGWKLDDLDPEAKKQLEADLPKWTEDSFAGYLGNVTAGRVANRFDLGGINFAIDAACASSLAALYVAIADLRAKTSDVVLLGAADTHNQPGDYLSFSKTHALSPQGRCKTFDSSADGIVISEGIAMLVLKRLSDAERDGDRIYSVIRGIGGSSDGRDFSLTAPRPDGQVVALERAYINAGISPATVELIEAHGTGTVAGDRAEVEALTKVFSRAGASLENCAIGSVKTNIGHTKAAAGLASLIKVSKSLYHKVMPATINVNEPNPACKFGEGPFYLNTDYRPWINSTAGTPRRASVSAFGFGGTNFHAVLEEYVPAVRLDESPVMHAWPSELFIWKSKTAAQLGKALSKMLPDIEAAVAQRKYESGATSYEGRVLLKLATRCYIKSLESGKNDSVLSIVASSFEDLTKKINRAIEHLSKENCGDLAQQDIHFASEPKTLKTCFLFPGQGSQKVDMLKELGLYFPEIRRTIEEADGTFNDLLPLPLSKYIYPPKSLSNEQRQKQQEQLTSTHIAQPAVGLCDLAMMRLLSTLGVTPDMVAGHSYGEYVALHAAGYISETDLLHISAERGRLLAGCAADNPGAMAAVAADGDTVAAVIRSIPGAYVANFNAPQQTIISGNVDSVERALEVFQSQGIACKKIPVSAAFHTPLMESATKPLMSALQKIEFGTPTLPVFANSTAAIYPRDSAAAIEQLSEHIVKPVNFAQQLTAMYEAGARIFVEVGPGAVLTGLTQATLKNSDAIAVATDGFGRNSLGNFLNVLATLLAHGVAVDLGKLFWSRIDSIDVLDPAPERKVDTRLLYRVNSTQAVRLGDEAKLVAPASVPVLKVTTSAEHRSESIKRAGGDGRNGESRTNGDIDRNGEGNGSNGQKLQVGMGKNVPDTISKGNSPAAGINGQPGLVPTNGRVPAGLGKVEQVMLEFQQNMLQMTNQFLQTQQQVMLAYLQSQQGNGNGLSQSLPQVNLEGQANLIQQLQKSAMSGSANDFSDPLAAYSGNGTNNVHSGSNGNGAANGYGVTSDVSADDSFDPSLSADGNETSVASEADASADDRAKSTEQLIEKLFEIVSDRTGYPVEMLDPELDLEADLGIDSIKRIEILNSFRKLLPQDVQERLEGELEVLAGTKTLLGISNWLRSMNTAPPAAGSTAAQESASQMSAEHGIVGRGTLSTVTLPSVAGKSRKLSHGTLIVADHSGVAELVAAQLKKSGNQSAIVSHSEFQPAGSGKALNLTDDAVVAKFVADLRKQYGSIRSLIYLPAISSHKNLAVDLQLVQPLFVLTKALASDLRAGTERQRASLITATSLGGAFGVDKLTDGLSDIELASQAALIGFTKSVAREWKGLHAKSLDFGRSEQASAIATQIVTELLSNDQVVEVGLIDGKRIGLEVVEAAVTDGTGKLASASSLVGSAVSVTLDASSVILVTGGARGITAEITIDLAKRCKSNFVILGRQPRPLEKEAQSTVALSAIKELKAAIIEDLRKDGHSADIREAERRYQQLMKEREIRNTLAAIQEAGSTVKYYAVDVCDELALGKLIDSVYDSYGTIDAVIHGAGIIEDAWLVDKQWSSFDRVFQTKVKGARTLLRKLRLQSLKYLCFFSSVVGRTGNAGQCDYSAANEALNKLAVGAQKRTPGRVVSVMWGPWDGGMAPPELKDAFAEHGWSMISPQDGTRSFYEELATGQQNDVEVLLVGGLPDASKPGTSIVDGSQISSSSAGVLLGGASVEATDPQVFKLVVNVSDHRYLRDHMIDGIPVLPMAAAVEIMLESAQSLLIGKTVQTITGLDIPSGIMFDGAQKDLWVRVVPEAGVSVGKAIVTIESGRAQKKVNYRCQVHYSDAGTPTAGGTGEDVGSAGEAAGAAGKTAGATRKTVASVCNAASIESSQLLEANNLAAGLKSLALQEPEAATALPSAATDLYGRWLFHGPLFQGLREVSALGRNGAIGRVTGQIPKACVGSAGENAWIVDPTLLDSAMQLAGVWARHYFDITVLPTGFQSFHVLVPGASGEFTVRVLSSSPSSTELICDLGIFDESGRPVLIMQGLHGVGNKSFNRFAAQANVFEMAR